MGLPEFGFFELLLFLLIEFFAGYTFVTFRGKVWISWIFPIGSVACVHILAHHETPLFRMLCLILVLLTGMKIVMALHYPKLKFTIGKWFLYCFTWVGMNPELFFKTKSSPDYSLLYRGLLYATVGASILLAVHFIVRPVYIPTRIEYYVYSVMILIGLSQLLHFGLLNINAFFLQVVGYPAYTLFRAPLSAGSLRDFWGKRWNIPFTEMTSIIVYRPILKKMGEKQAVFLSFIFSGLLHEVALSLPVKSGYGLPLLYFTIQLCFILIERKLFGDKKPGMVWVICCLLLPLPILFHQAIMNGVFWPMIL